MIKMSLLVLSIMIESGISLHVQIILSDPLTTSALIDQLAHDCLVAILVSRDLLDYEAEEEYDALLRQIRADPRYTDQRHLQARMNALY